MRNRVAKWLVRTIASAPPANTRSPRCIAVLKGARTSDSSCCATSTQSSPFTRRIVRMYRRPSVSTVVADSMGPDKSTPLTESSAAPVCGQRLEAALAVHEEAVPRAAEAAARDQLPEDLRVHRRAKDPEPAVRVVLPHRHDEVGVVAEAEEYVADVLAIGDNPSEPFGLAVVPLAELLEGTFVGDVVSVVSDDAHVDEGVRVGFVQPLRREREAAGSDEHIAAMCPSDELQRREPLGEEQVHRGLGVVADERLEVLARPVGDDPAEHDERPDPEDGERYERPDQQHRDDVAIESRRPEPGLRRRIDSDSGGGSRSFARSCVRHVRETIPEPRKPRNMEHRAGPAGNPCHAPFRLGFSLNDDDDQSADLMRFLSPGCRAPAGRRSRVARRGLPVHSVKREAQRRLEEVAPCPAQHLLERREPERGVWPGESDDVQPGPALLDETVNDVRSGRRGRCGAGPSPARSGPPSRRAGTQPPPPPSSPAVTRETVRELPSSSGPDQTRSSSLARRAPVGQCATQRSAAWRSASFKGASKGTPTRTSKPRPMNASPRASPISRQIATQIPQAMHLPGS